MKVLWITYGMFPEVAEHLSGNKNIKGSGGWLLGAAEGLITNTEIELTIAIVNRAITKRESFQGRLINYELIPFGKGFDKYHHGYDEIWRNLSHTLNPDVVHIHGIESTLALSYIKAAGNKNAVVSIQGIAGIISRYYYDGLTPSDIFKNITLRDLITLRPLTSYKKDFERRGKFEAETISLVKHIIGRTSWDKAHVWAINPNSEYHFCNETLREAFYGKCWNYDDCSKHTIFVSQGTSPFKGIHYLLKALPLVLRQFPDTKLVIAGNAPNQTHGSRLCRTGYQKYIDKLIQSLNLTDIVEYTGPLDSHNMVRAYLSSNVFVCPSTIENSSNSVAEAQILGVPLIASYAGGIPDMIPNADCGTLVRVGEHEMLAKSIVDIFGNSKFFDNTCVRKLAADRHDPKANAIRTLEIYNSIINNQ